MFNVGFGVVTVCHVVPLGRIRGSETSQTTMSIVIPCQRLNLEIV